MQELNNRKKKINEKNTGNNYDIFMKINVNF